MKRTALHITAMLGLSFAATACSSATEQGTNTAQAELVGDVSQSLGIGHGNGPSCDTRRFDIPRLPRPFFNDYVTYTTTTAQGDAADVYAPDVPVGFRHRGVEFPAVVVLQGGSVYKEQYSEFASKLSRYGYVVILPQRITTAQGQTGPFANVRLLTQGFEHLKAESARDGSPIEGLVDASKVAVVGHSLGGATALQAVGGLCNPPLCIGTYAPPAELKAAAVYGTSLRNRPPLPGYIDVDTSKAPVAMIHGSQDGISLIPDARATFNLLEEPKAFFRINGANHYGINNANNVGGRPDAPPALDQAEGIDAIVGSTALFFGIYVQGDGSLGPSLDCFRGTKDGVVTIEN